MSTKQKAQLKKAIGRQLPLRKEIPPGLDADLFAAKWNTSPTLKAFSENIGVSASTCATVAARLRSAGYALKWFRRGRPRLLKI